MHLMTFDLNNLHTGHFLECRQGRYCSAKVTEQYLLYKYINHSMRYLFGIYKELIKCGLQSNSEKLFCIVVYMALTQNWTSRGFI